MVATEVKQKEATGFGSQKNARLRIESLRERLEIESSQLNELRSKLLDAEQTYYTDSFTYVWDVDGTLVDEIFSGTLLMPCPNPNIACI